MSVLSSNSAVIVDCSAKFRVQSLPTRAPEVWQGLPCQHSSDVWSFAATVSADLRVFKKGQELI
jgi:hypothetical protein